MDAPLTDADAYFSYLTRRTRMGYWYRRAWLYPKLMRHMPGRAVDIGCGIGDLIRARPGMVGVDINPAAVAYCRAQGLDARPMQADALPFDDASFDTAVLDNVLEHLAEPRPLLAEARRILAPGGSFVVGVPGERGYAIDADHKRFYDESGLQGTVAAAGFAPRHLLRVPFALPGLTRWSKNYMIYGVFRAV